MKTQSLSQNKGMSVIEVFLVLAIIAIIVILLAGGRLGGYTTWTQQDSYQPSSNNGGVNNIPSNPDCFDSNGNLKPECSTSITPIPSQNPTPTNTSPVITLYGDNPYKIFHPGTIPVCDPPDNCPPRDDVYKEPGFKAIDKEDGDITSKVIIVDEMNKTTTMNPCNTWYKKYTVKDSKGNVTIVRREIEECFGV